MLNTFFQIGTGSSEGQAFLILEIGENFFSKAVIDLKTNSILSMHVHTFGLTELKESVAKLIDEIKNEGRDYQQVIVASAFPEAILVPRKYFKEDAQLLKATYHLQSVHCLQDTINEWQLVNSYAWPLTIFQQVNEAFPSARYIHSYTSSFKVFNAASAENEMDVYFVSNRFRVVVKKAQQVQLIQTYSYTSPMDVVYFLLKICTEFGMTQEETAVRLSGFVTEDSPLYKELYNYFLNLEFSSSNTLSLPSDEHPAHFFTNLNNLFACASSVVL